MDKGKGLMIRTTYVCMYVCMYVSKTPMGHDGRLRNILVYRYVVIFQKTKSLQQLTKTLRILPNESSRPILTKNIECVACQGAEQDLILRV